MPAKRRLLFCDEVLEPPRKKKQPPELPRDIWITIQDFAIGQIEAEEREKQEDWKRFFTKAVIPELKWEIAYIRFYVDNRDTQFSSWNAETVRYMNGYSGWRIHDELDYQFYHRISRNAMNDHLRPSRRMGRYNKRNCVLDKMEDMWVLAPDPEYKDEMTDDSLAENYYLIMPCQYKMACGHMGEVHEL